MHQAGVSPVADTSSAQQFANRMTVAREKAGLSQRALAQLVTDRGVKIDASAITRIERSQREAKISEAACISAVLGFTLDELAPRTDDALKRAHLGSGYRAHEAAKTLMPLLSELWGLLEAATPEAIAAADWFPDDEKPAPGIGAVRQLLMRNAPAELPASMGSPEGEELAALMGEWVYRTLADIVAD